MGEFVKIYSYKLNRKVINKCIEEERELKSEDVEIDIHRILKDNDIKYKNKLNETWSGYYKTPKYNLEVEIYVNINEEEKAKELIGEYLNR